MHADNSPCHAAYVVLDFVSQRKVRFAPHPLYSPDIAPSDFFPFGGFRGELRGSRFQTGEELLVEIRKLRGEISLETLRDVFQGWMPWCESLIASNENYFK
jgi:hypothetical protein